MARVKVEEPETILVVKIFKGKKPIVSIDGKFLGNKMLLAVQRSIMMENRTAKLRVSKVKVPSPQIEENHEREDS